MLDWYSPAVAATAPRREAAAAGGPRFLDVLPTAVGCAGTVGSIVGGGERCAFDVGGAVVAMLIRIAALSVLVGLPLLGLLVRVNCALRLQYYSPS